MPKTLGDPILPGELLELIEGVVTSRGETLEQVRAASGIQPPAYDSLRGTLQTIDGGALGRLLDVLNLQLSVTKKSGAL